MNTNERAKAFCDSVIEYYGESMTRMLSQPPAEREEIELAGLKYRFQQLREAIPMVKKLADNEGIHEINELNDIVPLLFDHTMYKSYPPSMLYEGRFVPLTKWLSKLTAVDLSGLDASKCRTLDDWLMTLHNETDMFPFTTSGTTGTMSFIPRSKADWAKFMQQYRLWAVGFGNDKPAPKFPFNMHTLYPYFRSGAGHLMANDLFMKYISGAEERFHAAYPGRLSPDVLLLTQRMRAAAANGELDRLEISPELRAKRDEFVKLMESRDEHVAGFFDELSKKLRGERVFMSAVPSMLYQMATAGLARGDKALFSPESMICSGGGFKGASLPDNWQEPVKEYLGVDHIHINYGMSEMLMCFLLCEHGHYHTMPGIIPFVLDPETSKPLPRKGTVTGRWAHYDLNVESHWGGFITGDEVTIHWGDQPCACGRTGPYLNQQIRRYSEISKGGDKITCSATQGAYEDAMDFLVSVDA